MITDFVKEYFDSEAIAVFAETNACRIKKEEIVDGNFQWQYGASNNIFIPMALCDMDHVEAFAVQYAKWLYAHQLGGSHRINIIRDTKMSEITRSNQHEWYNSKSYVGFYVLGFGSGQREIHGDYHEVKGNINLDFNCKIEDYFNKLFGEKTVS